MSQARLQSTLHSTCDGILVLEETASRLEATLVNRAFCELWGLASEDLIHLPLADLVFRLKECTPHTAAIETLFGEAVGGRESHAEGVEIRSPRAVVDLLARRMDTGEGEDRGLIVTARDVTRRVDGERDLRRSVDELSRAKSEIESTN